MFLYSSSFSLLPGSKTANETIIFYILAWLCIAGLEQGNESKWHSIFKELWWGGAKFFFFLQNDLWNKIILHMV